MKSDVIIPEYTIRQCEALEEFEACVQMQRDIWEYSDLDVTPLRSYVVTRYSGGFTLGAFDASNKLLGMAHALAAFDEKLRPYYYSQMLAVVRRYCANIYGANSSSVFHRGMDTDRLFIEWWVRSPRVADALEGVRRVDKPE